MNTLPKVIMEIRSKRAKLSATHKKIADFIINAPERVVKSKVHDIAQECKCNDAQVVRFCQHFGYAGIHEFRSALVSDFLPVHPESAKDGSLSNVKDIFFNNNFEMLKRTVNVIDESSFVKAAARILEARRILLFGEGASGIVAADFEQKLLRMGFSAFYYSDISVMKQSVALAESNDVFVAFSFSGENCATLNLAEIAAEKNAAVISVTGSPESRIGKLSEIILQCSAAETTVRMGAMTSRLSQLLAVDFMCITLVMNAPERIEENVIRTHYSIYKPRTEEK